MPPSFAEFFAGGGMVRAALGSDWRCVLANDIDPGKCAVYRANWPGDELIEGDVASLDRGVLMQPIDLYWASSPCQDFSLAGRGRGLGGARSGVFSAWLNTVAPVIASGYAPRIIAFENVTGLLSRREGQDLTYILEAFIGLGYRVGAVELDAQTFLPQSRPRLFVIALRQDIDLPWDLRGAPAQGLHGTARMERYVAGLPPQVRAQWIWWNLPRPQTVPRALSSLIDLYEGDWFDDDRTQRLLSLMSPANREKTELRRKAGGIHVGTVYKRGRPDATGAVRQRAEVRFDGVAGCLRTPAGGSSRQTVLVIEEGRVRARLLFTREAARLMGLPETYRLPQNYNAAYKVAGDGVAVPVVRHLAEHLFMPLIGARSSANAA